MTKYIYIITALLFFTIISCSTKKNNFASRSYHSVTTKYNILYNGNLALEKGKQELKNDYEDNFWELLPVEDFKIEKKNGEIKEEGDTIKGSFDIAEEKAVKAVQKHGMQISGKEKNSQIDEAYLLLGKARYYSQRFVPALEAFDYSLKKDFTSSKNIELRIWKAKTLIRLQNEERAYNELNILLKKHNLNKAEKEEAHSILAMAQISMDSIPEAIEQLLEATETDKNVEQHARNLFILGQLYRAQDNIDSSKWAFQRLIDYKKAPNTYRTHAYLQQVQNTTDSLELVDLRKDLARLAKDPTNKNYLDEIHYFLAEINFKQGNDKDAVDQLQQSVAIAEGHKYQKAISYERLGDFYFDKTDFVMAAHYYDSVREYVEVTEFKKLRKLDRKIKNLEDVVFFEAQLEKNDSILTLVHMSDVDRTAYFENYITELKKADEIVAIQQENIEKSILSGNLQLGSQTGGNEANKGKWYFYNTQTVSYGKSEFQKYWGNRVLKDNWRWSVEKSSNVDVDNEVATTNNTVANEDKYDVNAYLNSIPNDSIAIQNLKDENSNALYQLGLIYKDKFQAYSLAKDRLERFLKEEPKEKLVLPAKYHLYKIYEKLGNPELEQLKKDIVENYPDSKYANNITNPLEITVKDSIQTPEKHYEKVFCDYEYEYYDSVLAQCDIAIKQYQDEPIQPKFELLRAYALYFVKGKQDFVESLEYVIANFPKTDEAIHAQEVLDRLNGVVKTKETEKTKTEDSINPKNNQNKEHKTQLLDEEAKRQKVLELIKNQPPPSEMENKDK